MIEPNLLGAPSLLVSHNDTIPESLESALGAAFGSDSLASVRERTLDAAGPRLAGRRRQRVVRIAAPFGVAALIALAVWLTPPTTPTTPTRQLTHDLNNDGVVDILDAQLLAIRLDAGDGIDINNDGLIDKADVDALAMRVVSLGGHS